MNTITKSISGMIAALRRLGNTETIEYSNEEVIMLHPELVEKLKDMENGKLKKEVENPINVSGGSNKGKGLRQKYESPEINVINENPQKNLEKMTKILKGEERGE